MNNLPKRKRIRIENYDYSMPGAYFITICVANRKPILWNVGAATCRPNLSKIGNIVETAISQIPEHYPMISVDKYCVMPDHIHMILSINADENGRQGCRPYGVHGGWAYKKMGIDADWTIHLAKIIHRSGDTKR